MGLRLGLGLPARRRIISPSPPPVGEPPGTFGYRQTVTESATSTVKTYASIDFSTAHSTRMVAAIISWQSNVARTILSVTIGGISATLAVAQGTSTGANRVEIWYAAVPNGTSGDVVVTFSGDVDNGSACMVWSGYPASQTPVDSGGATAASGGLMTISDLAVTSGGFAVAGSAGFTTGNTWAWSGADALAERVDAVSNQNGYSGIDIVVTASSTLDDMTCDPLGTSRSCIAAASWA